MQNLLICIGHQLMATVSPKAISQAQPTKSNRKIEEIISDVPAPKKQISQAQRGPKSNIKIEEIESDVAVVQAPKYSVTSSFDFSMSE